MECCIIYGFHIISAKMPISKMGATAMRANASRPCRTSKHAHFFTGLPHNLLTVVWESRPYKSLLHIILIYKHIITSLKSPLAFPSMTSSPQILFLYILSIHMSILAFSSPCPRCSLCEKFFLLFSSILIRVHWRPFAVLFLNSYPGNPVHPCEFFFLCLMPWCLVSYLRKEHSMNGAYTNNGSS